MIFSRVYAPRQLDEDATAPAVEVPQEEPGTFSGALDAFGSGIKAGAYEMQSAALTSAASLFETDAGRSVLGTFGINDDDYIARVQQNALDARLKAGDYAPDPNVDGAAANLIYGVTNGLSKYAMSVGVTLPAYLAGPHAGAAASAAVFGGTMGVNRTQELKEKGVDAETAQKAGVASGIANAVFSVVPGAVGVTTPVRVTTGAGLGIAGAASESYVIRDILQNADYDGVADEFDPTDPISLATAGVLGGVIGGVPSGRLSDAVKARPRQKRTYKTPAGKDVTVDVEDAARKRAETLAEEANLPVEPSDGPKRRELRKIEPIVNESINKGEPAPGVEHIADAERMEEIQRRSLAKMAKAQAEGGPILQNRDRSSKESQAQMNAIAARPDYFRVGTGNLLSDGAPVVTDVPDLPDIQRGRAVTIVDSQGERYKSQYAVVDADQVVTSNAIDGTPNEAYGIVQNERPTAIAGNGRVTGLTEGYRRGTMEQYRADMMGDADAHGINPDVIAAMERPILVRLVDRDSLPPDIGDRSNTRTTQGLSMVEQAMNDTKRLDLAALTYTDAGNVSIEAVSEFVRALPGAEAAELTRNGVPSEAAWKRLHAAIFQAAYGNPELTQLLDAQSCPQGIKTVLNAYLRLAPRVLDIDGAGALDFRASLAEVLNEIQVARNRNRSASIREIAAQTSMNRSTEAQAFLDFFAQNDEATGKKAQAKENGIVDAFTRLADYAKANKEALAAGPGLFGDVPNPTRADLMAEFSKITGVEVDPRAFDDVSTLSSVALTEHRRSAAFAEKADAVARDMAAARRQVEAETAPRPAPESRPAVDAAPVARAADAASPAPVQADAGAPVEAAPAEIPADIQEAARAAVIAAETAEQRRIVGEILPEVQDALARTDSIEARRVAQVLENNPEMRIQIDGEDGTMTAAEFLAREEAKAADLERMADQGIGAAVTCIINNKGV